MNKETLNSGKIYLQSARTKIRKVGSIEKVNRLNNYHLHFHVEVIWEMLKRRKVQIGIASIVFLALSTVFVVDYTGTLGNKEIFQKFYDSPEFITEDRFSTYNIEGANLFEDALLSFRNGNFDEAIPVFEGLIQSEVYFKDICMWYLAGCYIATNEDDKKTTKLLVELSQIRGNFSVLALKVLKAKKKK